MPLVEATSREHRRSRGVYYTPRALVEALLDLALDPAIDDALRASDPADALGALRVLDPACGDGAFLVAAAERLARAAALVGCDAGELVSRCVVGVDVDGDALDACDAALRALGASTTRLRRADALFEGPAALGGEAFDVVVGNPPYLNQLERATASSRETAGRVSEWSGGLVKGYADAAAAFWLLAARALREGGRCALVLPRSILSTRDAAGVRAAVAETCAVESVWFDDSPMFDASVRVCAPVVRRTSERGGKVKRRVGIPMREGTSVALPRSTSWSMLLPSATAAPRCSPHPGRTLGDIVNATADFRDQYYGLAGRIVEHDEAAARWRSVEELETRFPRLITSGLIDRDGCSWGVRPARVHGRVWEAPRIDRAALEAETNLGPWLAARRVPKILLATQTRVLEPLLDEGGVLAPCVPVITITVRADQPDKVDALRRAHRALLSPHASAWAAREFAGAALSPGAIKLSAKQALTIPLYGGDEPIPDELASWFAQRLTTRRGTAPCGRRPPDRPR